MLYTHHAFNTNVKFKAYTLTHTHTSPWSPNIYSRVCVCARVGREKDGLARRDFRIIGSSDVIAINLYAGFFKFTRAVIDWRGNHVTGNWSNGYSYMGRLVIVQAGCWWSSDGWRWGLKEPAERNVMELRCDDVVVGGEWILSGRKVRACFRCGVMLVDLFNKFLRMRWCSEWGGKIGLEGNWLLSKYGMSRWFIFKKVIYSGFRVVEGTLFCSILQSFREGLCYFL